MVIVEVCLFSKSAIHPGSDYICFQLVTGRMPFPEFTDPNVTVLISKGKRPPMPRSFDAPGITPAVWKIATKCWHEKANKRPEVNAVLRSLENLADPGPGMYTLMTYSYLEWDIIDLRIWQMTRMRQYHSPNGRGDFLTAEYHFYWRAESPPSNPCIWQTIYGRYPV